MPNRSADLSRPKSRKSANEGRDIAAPSKGVLLPSSIPPADPEWHPICTMIWEAMQTSGQSYWYQNSDWAYAYAVMDDVNMYKRSPTRSAMHMAAINDALRSLMLTEGERRRARIELERPDETAGDAELKIMADYRQALNLEA